MRPINLHIDGRKVGRAIRAKAATEEVQISELVTVPNVPMVSTGIDYPTSTGDITLTEQHLQDLIASQDDPAIHPPRTKIGHSDPRFNARVTPDGEVLDGEPSLGTWMNLRLGDNGQTVYGDLVGCPRWFAQIASTAYPSRSIEGNFDVETVTGHHWSLMVDAVAMLGVIGPGVTTLADLPVLFSTEGPEGVQVIEAEEGAPMSVIRSSASAPAVTAETAESEPTPVEAAGTVRAQAQVDDIRRQFYESLDSAQFWWWIRAMYVDPGELIVDDDDGGLYRVGFTTADDGTVAFEEPVPVKIQYVDQPKEEVAAAIRASVSMSLHSTGVAASFSSREESRPGGSMDRLQVISALRARGVTPEQLPDDADDAAIVAYLSEPVTASSSESAEGASAPSGGEGGGTPRREESQPAPAPAPAAATSAAIPSTAEASRIPGSTPTQFPEGTIVVDRATWEEVANQARQGAELAARTAEDERDSFLNNAIKAGKFPPSRKDHWLSAWKADPEGTRGVIDSLAPGLIPVEARGTAGTGKEEQVAAAEASSYDQSWLTPAERARIKTATTGEATPQLVIQGGD